jgi:hypothetical protein
VKLNAALRTCAGRLLEEQHTVTPEEIVECARRNFAAVFAVETDRLVLAAARQQARALMKDQAADDQYQPQMPGILFPVAIAIPIPGSTDHAYVRHDKATLEELEAGRIIRVRNVENAQAALDIYNESVETLRPYFDDEHPTTLDAYRAWREAEDGAA